MAVILDPTSWAEMATVKTLRRWLEAQQLYAILAAMVCVLILLPVLIVMGEHVIAMP
jgi:hypothetical protein